MEWLQAGIAAVLLLGYLAVGLSFNLDPEFVPSFAHPSLALAVVTVIVGALVTSAYLRRPPGFPESPKAPQAPAARRFIPDLPAAEPRDPLKDAARRSKARARRRENSRRNSAKREEGPTDEPVPEEEDEAEDEELETPAEPQPEAAAQPKQWEKGLYDEYGKALDGPWMTHLTAQPSKQHAPSDQNEPIPEFRRSFEVEPEAAAAVVGPKGANIRQAQQLAGVLSIQLDKTTVEVIATSEYALDRAYELLYMQRSVMDLEQQWMYSWLLGDKGEQIKQLEQVAAVRAKVLPKDPEQPSGEKQLALVGRPGSIEDGSRWLQAQLEAVARDLGELQLQWLLSNKAANIRDLEKMFGVVRIDVDKAGMKAVLYGPRQATTSAWEWMISNSFHAYHSLAAPMQLLWLRGGQRINQLLEIPGLNRATLLTEESAVLLVGQQQAVWTADQWLSANVPKPHQCSSASFSVDPELLGLMLGKKGTRLRQVEADTQVWSIDVEDSGQVNVLGPTPESVSQAKRALELFSDKIEASRLQLRWLLLEKGSALKRMEEAASLHRSNIERHENGGGTIELVGSAESVIRAKVWMEAHCPEETVPITDLCVGWLLEQKAAAVQEMESVSGGSVLVDGDKLTLSVLGTDEGRAAGLEWLAARSHELRLHVDEPGALTLLLKNRAEPLKLLKSAAKLNKVVLSKEQSELLLLGEPASLEKAREWLHEQTKVERLELRTGLIRWVVGRRGSKLRSHMQAIEKAAGSLVSIELEQELSALEITGSQPAIDNVKAWLAARSHFTIESLPILASRAGYIIGKKGANIKEIMKATGVDSVDIEDDTCVLLEGTQEAVQKAIVYVEIQSHYFEQSHHLEEQITELKGAISVLPPIRKAKKNPQGAEEEAAGECGELLDTGDELLDTVLAEADDDVHRFCEALNNAAS